MSKRQQAKKGEKKEGEQSVAASAPKGTQAGAPAGAQGQTRKKKPNFGPRPEDQARITKKVKKEQKEDAAGRNLTKQAKDMAATKAATKAAQEFYHTSVYHFAPYTDAKLNTKVIGKRLKLPKAPANLPPQVKTRLTSIFTGDGKPFVGVDERTESRMPEAPVAHMLNSIYIYLAVRSLFDGQMNSAKPTVHVLSSTSFIGVVIGAMTKCARLGSGDLAKQKPLLVHHTLSGERAYKAVGNDVDYLNAPVAVHDDRLWLEDGNIMPNVDRCLVIHSLDEEVAEVVRLMPTTRFVEVSFTRPTAAQVQLGTGPVELVYDGVCKRETQGSVERLVTGLSDGQSTWFSIAQMRGALPGLPNYHLDGMFLGRQGATFMLSLEHIPVTLDWYYPEATKWEPDESSSAPRGAAKETEEVKPRLKKQGQKEEEKEEEEEAQVDESAQRWDNLVAETKAFLGIPEDWADLAEEPAQGKPKAESEEMGRASSSLPIAPVPPALLLSAPAPSPPADSQPAAPKQDPVPAPADDAGDGGGPLQPHQGGEEPSSSSSSSTSETSSSSETTDAEGAQARDVRGKKRRRQPGRKEGGKKPSTYSEVVKAKLEPIQADNSSRGERTKDEPADVVAAGRRGVKTQRNREGRLDGVIPIQPQSNRAGVPAIPPVAVRVRGPQGTAWAVTRAFASWFQTQISKERVAGVACGMAVLPTVMRMLWRGDVKPVLFGAVGAACGYYMYESPYAHDGFGLTDAPLHPLEPKYKATLANIVAHRFSHMVGVNKKLTMCELTSMSASAAQAMAGGEDAIAARDILPNVLAEWDTLVKANDKWYHRYLWTAGGAAAGYMLGWSWLTLERLLRAFGMQRVIGAGQLMGGPIQITGGAVIEQLGAIAGWPTEAACEAYLSQSTDGGRNGAKIQQLLHGVGPAVLTSWTLTHLLFAVLPEELIMKPALGWLARKAGGNTSDGYDNFALIEMAGYVASVPPELMFPNFVLRCAPAFMHFCTGRLPVLAGVALHLAWNLRCTYVAHTCAQQALLRRGYQLLPSLTQDGLAELHARALVSSSGSIVGALKSIGLNLSCLAISALCFLYVYVEVRQLFRSAPDSPAGGALYTLGRHVIGYAHPPMCVRNLPLGKIRPDATFRLHEGEQAQPCRPGQGFHLAGPYLRVAQVRCFAGCVHNQAAAATRRMVGIPKCFDSPDDYAARTPIIDAEIRESFPNTIPQIMAHYTKNVPPLLSSEQWVVRFPQAKAQTLFGSWIVRGSNQRRNYEFFIKKEKSILTEEEAGMLEGENGVVDKTWLKLDPRGISVPYEEIRVETGPWCYQLNCAMGRGFRHQIKYVPGETPRGLSNWFAWALSALEAGSIPFALAVQGDDSLLMIREEGRVVYVSSDLSRYDMSQRVAHFESAWELVRTMLVSPPDHVYEIISQQQGIVGGGKRYIAKGCRMKVKGTMASGDGVTITFNSLTLIMMVMRYLRSGREVSEFGASCAEVGFSATVQRGEVASAPLKVDFLQSRPWLEKSGGRVFAPKPGRILARFFWIPRRYTTEEKYKKDAGEMALGLLQVASHVPVINDICRRVVYLTKPVKAKWDDIGPAELQAWRHGDTPEENDRTIDEMADLYNVPVSSLQRFRERCRVWNFGEPIDIDEEMSHTARKLVAVDSQ